MSRLDISGPHSSKSEEKEDESKNQPQSQMSEEESLKINERYDGLSVCLSVCLRWLIYTFISKVYNTKCYKTMLFSKQHIISSLKCCKYLIRYFLLLIEVDHRCSLFSLTKLKMNLSMTHCLRFLLLLSRGLSCGLIMNRIVCNKEEGCYL